MTPNLQGLCALALQVADYSYVLEMGEIVSERTGTALLHDPRIAETYLGIAHGNYGE